MFSTNILKFEGNGPETQKINEKSTKKITKRKSFENMMIENSTNIKLKV